MITITEPLIDITMKVEIDLPQSKILEFLTQKGYEVKAYRQVFPATEEMLVSALILGGVCIISALVGFKLPHPFVQTQSWEIFFKLGGEFRPICKL